MKKISLLVILLSTLFFVAACSKTKTIDIQEPLDQTQKVEINEDGDEGKFKTTMENIFKKGKATTCRFVITDEGQTFDGALYVDGKKMRYSSRGTIGGQTFEANVIVKDGFSYSWTNMDTKGFKMKEIEGNNQEDRDVGAEERAQEMDFDCKKGVENGIFDLPSNIEFGELNMPLGN
ncbi:MAG: hypothetical protein WAZ12_02925 [Candidatus Absconditicoccaceae bacterium]